MARSTACFARLCVRLKFSKAKMRAYSLGSHSLGSHGLLRKDLRPLECRCSKGRHVRKEV